MRGRKKYVPTGVVRLECWMLTIPLHLQVQAHSRALDPKSMLFRDMSFVPLMCGSVMWRFGGTMCLMRFLDHWIYGHKRVWLGQKSSPRSRGRTCGQLCLQRRRGSGGGDTRNVGMCDEEDRRTISLTERRHDCQGVSSTTSGPLQVEGVGSSSIGWKSPLGLKKKGSNKAWNRGKQVWDRPMWTGGL